jgi:tetratricopeptide (TPR) repeat protein
LIVLCLFAATLFGCPSKKTPPAPPAPSMSDAEVIEVNNRGLGLMGQFDYDDATAAFQQVVDARPELIDVRTNLMIATFNRQLEGDEAAAIEMARDIVRQDSDHARAHYCLGLLLYRAGEINEATQHYTRALELDPDDAYAVYSVGQCLEQAGQLEPALAHYENAIALDPLLRSSYLRAAQVERRLSNEARANDLLDQFERLATNPQSRLLESKYTRMGPKAEAVAVMTDAQPPQALPAGPVFAEAVPLATNPSWNAVRDYEADQIASVSSCDINGDGVNDLFLPNALLGADATDLVHALLNPGNVVLLGRADGGFDVATNHPLASVSDVTAALWGDIDNDGLVDVYLCRSGANQLWMQTAEGEWQDRTDEFGVSGYTMHTTDGGLIDADHDGDLDILLINADGPNELLNNNRDGTFRAIGSDTGVAGDGRPSVGWVAADFDQRRDLDLLIIKADPPNEVYLNDRGWAYRANDERFAELLATNIDAAVAADVDSDGQVEIYALSQEDAVSEWRPNDEGVWRTVRSTERPSEFGPVPPMIAVIDVDGDGVLDCVHTTAYGWRAIRLGERWGELMYEATEPVAARLVGLAPVASHDGRGYSILGVRSGAPPVMWRPGSGRHEFVAITLSGGEDVGQSMRSNFSGIGTRISARVADRWTVVRHIRQSSGPGQSLQPIMVGLGGHEKIDFVQLDWPDGLFQTELALKANGVVNIAEKQRQVSSCPVLFAWDGSKFAFVTDLLGVGGMGYMIAPGEYAPPRPWERVLVLPEVLQPRDGRYVIKLAEPMEEACYLDAVHLSAIDLPPGWIVAIDERMGISDPQPTGDLLFYRTGREMLPARAMNDRGEDVSKAVRNADLTAAPVGEHDHRFIGLLAEEHVLMLSFDRAIDAGEGEPVLLIDGWVEYPYSQTMFAAWQAAAAYEAPTIESRSPGGAWTTVYEQFGYPAGMPRRMALPIDGTKLPPGATELRIRTNQEIYWDRVAIIYAEPCPAARITKLLAKKSELRESGYALRTNGAQRLPMYDYDERSPLFDMRRQAGFYTHVGPVEPLIESADGALAIFGPGEEVHAEFEAPAEGLPTGWTRTFILDAFGWCKDMDLYTKEGETIAPLPSVDQPAANVDELHRRFNTRYLSGY